MSTTSLPSGLRASVSPRVGQVIQERQRGSHPKVVTEVTHDARGVPTGVYAQRATRTGGTYRVNTSYQPTRIRISTLSRFVVIGEAVPVIQSSPRRRRRAESADGRKPLASDRQRELLRVVKEMFSNFHKRQQHFYLGGGASTSHIVVKAIQDFDTLRLFWPSELVRPRVGGNTYILTDDVMKRVQDRIRDTLNELESKGYLEKVGNRDERRWKPLYE